MTVSQDKDGAAAPLLMLGEHPSGRLLRQRNQGLSDCDGAASNDHERAERAVGDERGTVVRERQRASGDETASGREPIPARAPEPGDLPELATARTPRRRPRPGADRSTVASETMTTALERELARLNRAVAGMVRAEAARGRDDPGRQGGLP